MNMRELAKLCGVSIGAVSKAFHRHPSVPPRTRERILKIAAQHGYAPNPELSRFLRLVAQSRFKQVKPTIAVLFPWSHESNLVEEFEPTLNKIWKGLQADAKTMGYRIDPFWLRDPGMTAKRLKSILRARGLEALILFSCPEAYDKVDLDLSELSCVAIGRVPQNHPPITIDIDSFESSDLAMRNILAMGYKIPGLVTIDRNIAPDDGRFQSSFDYHRGKYFADSRPVPDFIMATRHDRPWSLPDSREIQRLGSWMKTYRPDVVLSHYNEVRTWIESVGFAIPSQVGFVSLNNPEVRCNAGISFDWEFVGRKAIVLMDQLLAKRSQGAPNYSEHYLIGPSWMAGSSIVARRTPLLACRKQKH